MQLMDYLGNIFLCTAVEYGEDGASFDCRE